jgi:hypothetical protein
MPPNIEYMRAEVRAMYPYPGWRKKVAKMSDGQVMAIYLKEQNKPKKKPDEDPRPPDDIPF